MVVNPVTIGPDAALAEALALMKAHGISGIPVVKGNGGGPGKLVGILTNRDVRFASDPAQKVAELMTRIIWSRSRKLPSTRARPRLLHKHRIEKLLVVDGAFASAYHRQGYREVATQSARHQGCRGSAARGCSYQRG
jgi:IMP dehydrogenase